MTEQDVGWSNFFAFLSKFLYSTLFYIYTIEYANTPYIEC